MTTLSAIDKLAFKWDGNHRRAFWRGRAAWEDGKQACSCPYVIGPGSVGYRNAWFAGFLAERSIAR